MTRPPNRGHYSYVHYADDRVAEQFDALRFGGPIGRYLARTQGRILETAFAPLEGRQVLDVGTGTGRAALALGRLGASVVGIDASFEMLRVADTRARRDGVGGRFARADAHALPFVDRSFDAAVCLRVLMHAVDWRLALAEVCRVARWRVVIDFPSSRSLAALESAFRSARKRRGANVEAYRVMAVPEVTEALGSGGFRVVTVERQFVLPIALHKRLGILGITRASEGVLAAAGLLRLLGSPVTVVAER